MHSRRVLNLATRRRAQHNWININSKITNRGPYFTGSLYPRRTAIECTTVSDRARCRPTMSDYYSVIARAVARLPSETDEARHAIYERARTAVQERLRNYNPPLSEVALASEQAALDAAISRLEADLSFSDLRRAARATIPRYILVFITGAAFVAGLVALIHTNRIYVPPRRRSRKLMASQISQVSPAARGSEQFECLNSGTRDLSPLRHRIEAIHPRTGIKTIRRLCRRREQLAPPSVREKRNQ